MSLSIMRFKNALFDFLLIMRTAATHFKIDFISNKTRHTPQQHKMTCIVTPINIPTKLSIGRRLSCKKKENTICTIVE